MSRIWQPQSIEVYREWLETIESEASDKLNDWEINFLDSIGTKLRKGWNLTEKQAEILERIYTDKTN